MVSCPWNLQAVGKAAGSVTSQCEDQLRLIVLDLP
jgi:hypothetical protein